MEDGYKRIDGRVTWVGWVCVCVRERDEKGGAREPEAHDRDWVTWRV